MTQFKVTVWTRKAPRLRPVKIKDLQVDEVFIEAPDVQSALRQALRIEGEKDPTRKFHFYVETGVGSCIQGLGDYTIMRHLQDQGTRRWIQEHCD